MALKTGCGLEIVNHLGFRPSLPAPATSAVGNGYTSIRSTFVLRFFVLEL